MLINEIFPRMQRCGAFTGVAVMVGLAVSAQSAMAQSYTAAPTPVYGSAESQANIRFQGPGLPGSEAQQPVGAGSRHALFDVAGYDGVIYSPVTPPYNSEAAYRTFAGQPMRGADALLAQDTTGAP